MNLCSVLAKPGIPFGLQRFNKSHGVLHLTFAMNYGMLESFVRYGSLTRRNSASYMPVMQLTSAIILIGAVYCGNRMVAVLRSLREDSGPHGFVEVFPRDCLLRRLSRYCT